MKENKKVFTSSASDRGIMVKFLKKGKVSLSFWGNDEPKNISYSETEIREFCEYLISNEKEHKNKPNILKDIKLEMYYQFKNIDINSITFF
jgi:hypothetical protein